MTKELLPGTSILRAEDDARYELGEDGNWRSMDYHCADCASDESVDGPYIGEYTILTVPVAELDAAAAIIDDYAGMIFAHLSKPGLEGGYKLAEKNLAPYLGARRKLAK